MTLVQNYISPKSSTGSVVFSILAHALVYGGLVFFLSQAPHLADKSEDYVDMSYQTLEEPPVPEKEVHVVKRAPDLETPVESKVTPTDTPKEMQDSKGEVAGTQAAAKPETNVGAETNGNAVATPYYKIKPKYPRAALVSGTEGWVLMQIDINEQGEVENVRVVDGEQRNLFQTEARRAVSQWKYRPFVDGAGHPLKKTDHPVRVDFKLQDAESSGS